ncbi:MAG: aldehyde dehydrogenase family protein, partial [Anaerolineae bacterium]|nr:aldehyde dehydrogenase family protein [Anaerolineae bacterium]
TTLELGGNGATIIDDSADIERAATACVMGGFGYSGQVCNSVQRVYIHRKRYDEFRDRFVREVEQLTLGDPTHEATDLGPLISDAAVERIQNWIAEAVQRGAKVLTGGNTEGRLFRPTVLEDVTEDMTVMCEEVFGPIVNLVPFDDFNAALEAVNASEYGLQAGVFTNDLQHAMLAARKLDVGGVMINNVSQWRVDQMPYGGNKNSGVGREGPRFSVEEMTKLKMVSLYPGA